MPLLTDKDYRYEERDYIGRYRSRSLHSHHHGCGGDGFFGGHHDGYGFDHHDGYHHDGVWDDRWYGDRYTNRNTWEKDGDACHCVKSCTGKIEAINHRIKRNIMKAYSGCQYAYIYTVDRQRVCPGQNILLEQIHAATPGIKYNQNTGELIFLREGDYKANFSVLTENHCSKRSEFALFLDRGQGRGPELVRGSEAKTDCRCRAFQTYRFYIPRGSALTLRNSGCNKVILPFASTSYPATAFLTVKRLES